jgi:hypothetical protein
MIQRKLVRRLRESAYRTCLARELLIVGRTVERQNAAALSMAGSSRIGDLVPTWWWLEGRRDIEMEDARHPVDGAPLRSHRVVNTPMWGAHYLPLPVAQNTVSAGWGTTIESMMPSESKLLRAPSLG